MAYRVYCDGLPLHDARSTRGLVLVSPKAILEDNSPGSFDFTILPTHPYYSEVKKMASEISIYLDDEEIFCGRVIDEKEDFRKKKICKCEGELAYLYDSIQRPAKYQGVTVRGYLQALVDVHNSQVEEKKQFQVGMVTVADSNDYLYKYTNHENTMECIGKDLIDTYGGHIRVRKVNGVKYIDYLAESPNTNTQTIAFGKNLLDFTKNFDVTDLATAIIPLGARLEESPIPALEAYTDIKSVNNGVDYVYSRDAVAEYGWITKVVHWDDVSVPENLKKKGEAYLSDVQFANMVLDVSGVDLHNLDVNIERIKILDMVRVLSKPHGLDRYFFVSKIEIDLEKVSGGKIILGKKTKTSFTSVSKNANDEVKQKVDKLPKKVEILQEAQDNASQLIHNATHGSVVTTPEEILVMNTADKETATKVWRWNVNGLGYSNTGYAGTYGIAITMDGQIAGERLVAGSVSAEKLSATYKSSVEEKIEKAEEEAIKHIDAALEGYWTSAEVEAKIETSEGKVLLEVSKTYATTDAVNSAIKATAEEINLTVSKKVGADEIISKINQSAESVAINAGKINFNGMVTANNYFKINMDGSFTTTKGTIGEWIVTSNKITSANGDVVLNSNGTISIGYASLGAEGNAFTIRTGMHLYTGNDAFSDGTDNFKIFNLVGTSSGSTLALSGNTVCTLSSSSKRYKDHVREMTLEDAEGLYNLPIVFFKYKDGYLIRNDPMEGKAIPGFYAEDVEEHYKPGARYADGKIEDWQERTILPAILLLVQDLKMKYDSLITKEENAI